MAGGDGGTAVARLRELTEAARREIVTLAADMGDPADARAALRRGVSLRRLHAGGVRNRLDQHAAARRLAAAGARVRTVPVLPVELTLIDGTTAALPHDPADPGAGAVVIDHPGTVAALRALVDDCWAGAEELGAEPDLDAHGLTAREGALLRQLADGSTDETAARRMGVSLRTVRRMTAHLMTRLGARSRFQAGARAAAHGWL